MRAIYYGLQWTWGIVQNLAGAALALILWRQPRFRFRNALVTRWPLCGSMSLGMFLFLGRAQGAPSEERLLAERSVLVHEYGHSIQSLILGPLYLPVVGLPSILWANVPACVRYRKTRHVSYYRMYQEAWANRLGNRITRLPAPEQKAKEPNRLN